MTLSSETPAVAAGTSLRASLVGTVPMIGLTVGLFAGSYITLREAPRLAADHFPLWALLLALGFVGAIGCVVSGFYAVDETVSAPPRDAAGPAISERDARDEFGRPVPDRAVRSSVEGSSNGLGPPAIGLTKPVEPWDEDSLPPPPARGPRPVLTTLDDPGDIGRALEEISAIQRELDIRREKPGAATQGSARA
ncbi:MAG: hypothetical protein ACREEC_04000 [Thermoplasmata archaeon]